MGARTTLDLRQIRLTDCRLACLFAPTIFLLNRANKLLLSHGAIETAKVAFDLAKITNFVIESHDVLQIAIFISQFVIKIKTQLFNEIRLGKYHFLKTQPPTKPLLISHNRQPSVCWPHAFACLAPIAFALPARTPALCLLLPRSFAQAGGRTSVCGVSANISK